MRKLLAVVLVTAPLLSLVPAANAYCSVEEGCSPCPPPTVVLKPKPHLEWVYC